MYPISTEAATDCRTNDEIIASIKAGNRDDIGILWEKNLRLVRWIIDTKIKPSTTEDRDDLEQQAYFGFIRAVDRYNIEGNASFSSFLIRGIMWELKRYYNRGGYIMRIPPYMKEQIAKYFFIVRRKQAADEPLDDSAIMKEMGIPPPDYETMLKAIKRQEITSLNSIIEGYEGEMSIQDTIPGDCDIETEAVNSMYLQDLRKYMQEAIRRLPEFERICIYLRYYQGHTLQEIAEVYGCTAPNIRQRIQYAFQMIRHGKYSSILREFL